MASSRRHACGPFSGIMIALDCMLGAVGCVVQIVVELNVKAF